MTWLIRLLIFFVLFFLARSFISRLFGSGVSRRSEPSRQRKQAQEIKTVGQSALKDPQCGIYVDRALAIPAQSEGETVYFCSEHCRDEYLTRVHR
jgi:YHS domain-containing protein